MRKRIDSAEDESITRSKHALQDTMDDPSPGIQMLLVGKGAQVSTNVHNEKNICRLRITIKGFSHNKGSRHAHRARFTDNAVDADPHGHRDADWLCHGIRWHTGSPRFFRANDSHGSLDLLSL